MLSIVAPVVRTLLPVTGIVWAIFELRRHCGEGQRRERPTVGDQFAVRLSALIGVVGARAERSPCPPAAIGTEVVDEVVRTGLHVVRNRLAREEFQTFGG